MKWHTVTLTQLPQMSPKKKTAFSAMYSWKAVRQESTVRSRTSRQGFKSLQMLFWSCAISCPPTKRLGNVGKPMGKSMATVNFPLIWQGCTYICTYLQESGSYQFIFTASNCPRKKLSNHVKSRWAQPSSCLSARSPKTSKYLPSWLSLLSDLRLSVPSRPQIPTQGSLPPH